MADASNGLVRDLKQGLAESKTRQSSRKGALGRESPVTARRSAIGFVDCAFKYPVKLPFDPDELDAFSASNDHWQKRPDGKLWASLRLAVR